MKLFCDDAVYYLEIHQLDPGKPNMLMMHGFMGSSESYSTLSKLLKPICNPITLDLAGHGRSEMTADPELFKADSQIRDLQSILDRLRLANLWLYGYSMGGRLAQNLFLDSPEQFFGLILESTHCGIENPDERQKRQAIDEQRAKEIEDDFSAFVDKWTSLPLFESPINDKSVDYHSIIKKQSPKAMAASLRGFGAGTAPFICDQMQKLSKPIGLIAGESDEKYVDKMREMHHLLPKSELHVAAGAGHRVHADQPEQIVSFLTHFLNRYG
jgi:2-succinyl-6-hydroxy-2,4-cyclohexadiene-1-carboxylate synthase